MCGLSTWCLRQAAALRAVSQTFRAGGRAGLTREVVERVLQEQIEAEVAEAIGSCHPRPGGRHLGNVTRS